MDNKLVNLNTIKVDAIKMQKMVFIYNALEEGWNIEKIGNQLCTAFNPTCVYCKLSEICDFYNEKNRWAV